MSAIFAAAFSRSQLKRAARSLSELSSPGVYILYGADPENADAPTAYIGESQNVAARLGYHVSNAAKNDSKYAYWSHTIALASRDKNLTKAHVMQVERQMMEAAQKNLDWTLKNGKGSHKETGGLPSHDKSTCNRFVEQAKILTGCLSLDLFKGNMSSGKTKPKVSEDVSSTSPETRTFYYSGKGFNARMQLDESSGNFVVLKSSVARVDETRSLPESTKNRRRKLIEDRNVIKSEEGLELQEDISFLSISGAAQAVSGAAVNGRIAWKTSDGVTYAEWEAENNEL